MGGHTASNEEILSRYPKRLPIMQNLMNTNMSSAVHTTRVPNRSGWILTRRDAWGARPPIEGIRSGVDWSGMSLATRVRCWAMRSRPHLGTTGRLSNSELKELSPCLRHCSRARRSATETPTIGARARHRRDQCLGRTTLPLVSSALWPAA